jgi:desampylase
MRLEISRGVQDAILAQSAGSPDEEICGLLLGKGLRVERLMPCRNVSAMPAHSFELDPRALVAAHREARAGGPEIVGHYHSHPVGPAAPSARDAAHAMGDGAVWLIAGRDGLTAWRSEQVGAFVELTMTCAEDA